MSETKKKIFDIFIDQKTNQKYFRVLIGVQPDKYSSSIYGIDELCRHIRFKPHEVLDDIQNLPQNDHVRKYIIDLYGVEDSISHSLAGQLINRIEKCYKCKDTIGHGTSICPFCEFDNFDHVYNFYYEKKMDEWSASDKIRLARKYPESEGPPHTWSLGPDKKYLWLRPRWVKGVYQRTRKKQKQIKIRSNNFSDLRIKIENLYKSYVNARTAANNMASDFMQDNGSKYRIAKTVDMWRYPKAERNKSTFDLLDENQREEILDEAEDEIEDVMVLRRGWPERDWRNIEKELDKIVNQSEPAAEKVAKLLRDIDGDLGMNGTVEECQEIARIISEQFFLSKAGQAYFEEVIEPHLKSISERNGSKTESKFWAKVWPELPNDEEIQEQTKNLDTATGRIKTAFESPFSKAKNYYDRFKMGLDIFQKMSTPLATMAREVNHPYHSKVSKYIGSILVERFRVSIEFKVEITRPTGEGGIPVRQITATVKTVPKWPGRAVATASDVAEAIGDVLAPFNTFLALYELTQNLKDDRKWVALVGELANLGTVSLKITAVRNLLGVSEKTAATFSRVAGGIGGAANAYVGIRDFYTDMDSMELEQGVCDLIVAAGGMLIVGGVATAGVLSLVGFVVSIIGGIGKWFFADTPHEKYIKGTEYYYHWETWHKENGYLIVESDWTTYIKGQPSYDELDSKNYYLGYRYKFQVAGYHNATIAVRFYDDRFIDKKLGDYYIKMKNGIGMIDLPDFSNSFPNDIKPLVKLYYKKGSEMKSFHESDSYYKTIPSNGKIHREKVFN